MARTKTLLVAGAGALTGILSLRRLRRRRERRRAAAETPREEAVAAADEARSEARMAASHAKKAAGGARRAGRKAAQSVREDLTRRRAGTTVDDVAVVGTDESDAGESAADRNGSGRLGRAREVIVRRT